MPVTVYPPLTVEAEPVVDNRGVGWNIGNIGSLDIIDATADVVATFSSSAWGYVEKT